MTLLITGGTSGIGRAVALERAAHGDTVHVVARDPAKLAALRRDLNGAQHDLFQADCVRRGVLRRIGTSPRG